MSSSVLASADPERHKAARFGVVLFRRTPNGQIMPGAAVQVANGDIAWRYAQAAAWDHENVGAVALTTSGDPVDDVLLASFGQVNLEALRH